MKPVVLVVGSRLLDPTQTQHQLALEEMEDYRFLLVSKRRGDKKGRLYPLPPHAQWVSLRNFSSIRASKVQLVHLVTGGQIAFRVARWAAEQEIPALLSFHGGKDLTESLARAQYAREYKRLFRSAAAITVPAPEGIELLVRRGAPREKVRVLPPSIKVPPTIETERHIPLLYASRWLCRKRPELAVEVAAQVAPSLAQHHVLHLVGEGVQAIHVVRVLARTQVSDRVKIHGYISHSQLTQLACRARVVLTTSEPGHDLLPPFLLEAQAVGSVVVAVGGPISAGAFADPALRFETVEAAALCCRNLLSDSALWSQASERARDHVAKNFSASRNVNGLRILYQECS